MKKKTYFLLFLLVSFLFLRLLTPGQVLAKERIIDEIDLLSFSVKRAANEQAEALYQRYGVDTALLFASPDYNDGQTLDEYARKIFFGEELGPNGFILAIDVENGVWNFTGFGEFFQMEKRETDRLFTAYNQTETYKDGVEDYLRVAGEYLEIALDGALLQQIDYPRYLDQVDLLSATEQQKLLVRLDEISERHRLDLVIAVVPDLDYREARVYALDFFENYGFGRHTFDNGAILLLAMNERDYGYAFTGAAEAAFTEPGLDYLEKHFLPELGKDRYLSGFLAFANAVDDFLQQAEKGTPYDAGNITLLPREKKSMQKKAIGLSLGIALLIALGAAQVARGKLKSVRQEKYAHQYIQEGSMALQTSEDIFLYRSVHRERRAQSERSGSSRSSSFSGSSGRSGSGRSGKF